ncbi:hypothetical protein HK103_002877 [Boothiomyces macroporosus]|uniref:Chitinase n=1 Tax=Boothiomyces macroporosus TaxID=261099 RepID=A0AAD5Y2F6_9FUNG|nr:hypothetical protein HK103_002877 [Boothiomyces macroporosus]
MFKTILLLINILGLSNGAGLFVYPKGLATSKVVADLIRYNAIANPKSAITTIHMYTGSIDYDGHWIIPFNNSSASGLLKVPKVKRLLYLFDSSLILQGLPYQELGYRLVLLVCQSNQVAGLTIDFEPLSQMIDFVAHLVKYMNPLLLSTKYNCRNKKFPNGRLLSVYGPAKQIKPILSVFRENNMYILNGYDLYGGLAYSESPKMYGQLLKSVVNQFCLQSNRSVSYSIIIPAAASTNEFSYYLRNGKKLSNGFHTFDYGNGYVEHAVQTINQLSLGSKYIETTLWAYTNSITVTQYSFFPTNPFQIL